MHDNRPPFRIGRACAALLVVTACSQPVRQPILWDEDRRVAGAVAPGVTMVLLAGGVPAVQVAWAPVRWPDDAAACTQTFTAGRGRGDTVYAAWRTGKDSTTTVVRVARSVNSGIAWGPPVSLGAAEPAPQGCARPAPGIALDTLASAVHVVFHGIYAGVAGTFSASTTRGNRAFATPVLIAKGARPAPAAIAALGDTLAVVFESPTVPEGAIWLAISLGAGHIPDIRMALSPAGIHAFSPSVAVGEGRVGAAWNEGRHGGQGPAAVAREGRWAR